MTVDGQPAGALKLVGVTENKQLNITFTTTGLLGAQPQLVTARVDLSNEKLPAVVESSVTGADLTQVLKILLPETNVAVTGRATGTLKLSGSLLDEDGYFTLRGLTGSATFTDLTINVADAQLKPEGPLVIDFAPNEVNFHQTRFTGPGTNVTLGGTVATGPGGRENLDVNGDINLRIFSGLSPDVFSSGVATFLTRDWDIRIAAGAGHCRSQWRLRFSFLGRPNHNHCQSHGPHQVQLKPGTNRTSDRHAWRRESDGHGRRITNGRIAWSIRNQPARRQRYS